MFDGSGWSPEKEARYENLGPATGVVPLPHSLVHISVSLTLVSMSLNPWLRPWWKLYSR